MKVRKLSLKWKVFGYLLGLAMFLLAVLWICQTVYLENFYKYIKEHELKDSIHLIEEALSGDDPSEEIEKIAREHELSLKVIDENGEELYSQQYAFLSVLQSLTTEQLKMYYEDVENNGGIIEFNSNDEMKKEKKRQKDQEDGETEFQPLPEWLKPPEYVQLPGNGVAAHPNSKDRPIEEQLVRDIRGGQETMVYGKIMKTADTDCLALATVKLTPVDATVQTLRVQLVYISIIILVLSLVLSLLISRSISKSIIKVNASAKELAHGNFDVSFEGRDYREISQLSDTLNYAATELAKTENLQRELIANVSHDLRTPLTMIIAYSEVMRDLPGENTPENVQVVIEEAQRLTNLVNDMLDISKLQAGALKLEKRQYDLTDSINGVMERYSKLKEQEQYQIRFLYDRHVQVCADEYKIFQVLYNLINNAVNYTGEDKTVVVEQMVKEDCVRIEVRDSGKGIPAEELDNVWERYYKIDKVHKRAIQGTGLGLSICKNILKLHQAQFGVESRLNVGSTFWFELKL